MKSNREKCTKCQKESTYIVKDVLGNELNLCTECYILYCKINKKNKFKTYVNVN